MNIYVEDNSKNMQDESFQKNYRNDVYVKIDNNFYNLSIITIARLKQDVEESFENEIVFCTPNNVIIVKEVTNYGKSRLIYPTFFGFIKSNKWKILKNINKVNINDMSFYYYIYYDIDIQFILTFIKSKCKWT